jgi:hypothetical protein
MKEKLFILDGARPALFGVGNYSEDEEARESSSLINSATR